MRAVLPMLLGAAVAAVVSLVIVSTASPPASAPAEVADASGEPAADATREVKHLHARVVEMEGHIVKLESDLAIARDRIEKLESVARGDIPRPEPSPDPEPEAAPAAAAGEEPEPELSEERAAAAARALAEKTRRDAINALRMMMEGGEEYDRRQQERIVQGVRDLAKEVGLQVEVARAVAYSLLDVHKRSRDQIRADLEGRDLAKIMREDLQPHIDDMFDGRDRAMEGHLEPKQMEVFRAKEAETRKRYDEWLRLAFPSRE